MSYDWLSFESKCDGNPPPPRATFFSVNGTGSPDPFGPGFSGDIGRQLNDELFAWQPIGYPAATFPMGPSADAGVAELVKQINRHPGLIALSGYSQGAIVVDKVWRDHIWSPNGDLNHRKDDIIGIVNFGDPMRCPGICNGNALIGQPIPKDVDGQVTGGIAGPDDLTPEQTPDFLLSCNNDGDLYGAAPVGASPWTSESVVGHDETMIYNVIQSFNMNNVLALALEVLKLMGNPTGDVTEFIGGLPALITMGATESRVVALCQALLNGGLFVASGFGPHGDYAKFVGPAVDFLHKQAIQALT